MYIARRAFRNYNQMVLPGSTVDPASTKWFKTRLKDHIIIEVTPQTFNAWNEYFEQKYGVSISKPEAKPEVKPEVKPEAKPEVKPEVKPEAKSEVKPEAKLEAKPEAKLEAKPVKIVAK